MIYNPDPVILLDLETRFDKRLSCGEKLFFAEVKSMCSRGGCYYKLKDMAKLFDVTTVSIKNWMKKLMALGYIEVVMDINDPKCKHMIRLK